MLELLNSSAPADTQINAVQQYMSASARSNAAWGMNPRYIVTVGGLAGTTAPTLQYPATTIREMIGSDQSSTFALPNFRYMGYCQSGNNLYACDGHNGGYNGILRRINMDTAASTTLTAPPAPARYAGILANVNDATLVRALGYTSAAANTDTCFRYSIAGNSWSPGANALRATRGSIAISYNGKVYVFFGYTGSASLGNSQVYDLASNSWSEGPVIDNQRFPNGATYNFGCLVGNTAWLFVPNPYNTALMGIIKINLDTWKITYHTTIYPVRYSAAALVNPNDGRIYVTGGVDLPPGSANFDTLSRIGQILVFAP